MVVATFGLALGLSASSVAQSTPDQVARLSTDLTPVGAERAASADGMVPAWDGGLAATPVDPKTGYVDPFADDAVLYAITAKNVDKYKELLSAGHLALFKRDPRTFKLNVYPTHRSASYPETVLAEIPKQAALAKTDGNHVRDVGKSTVPFPIPTDGLQVMWNHVFRWRGGSFERQIAWLPVAGTGKFFVVKLRQSVAFDQLGYMQQPRPETLFRASNLFLSPPSAIGLGSVTWEPTDPVENARARWVFLPATLDTRRLPSYDYDTLDALTGGLRTADQVDGWNGAPDRYDWKLVGKRELLIGYNSYKLADKGVRYADIVRPHHPDPELLRYEVHRVWVVEATLSKGRHHRYFRRVFYVDEDTWQVAQEEIYDAKGNLIRFGDHQMIQFYDVQVPWYAANIYHDIRTGGYLVTDVSNMEPYPRRWGFKGRNSDYLPSNLRSLGLR
jgi:hypothetical protein